GRRRCLPRTTLDGLVAVGRPVPGFAGEVVQAVGLGVLAEPLEGRARVRRDDRTAGREVDGQAALVHRRAGTGGRRVALVRRLLVDVVVRRSAVCFAQCDLLVGVAVAPAAERDAVGLGLREQCVDLVGDRTGDGDALHGDDVDVAGVEPAAAAAAALTPASDL